MKVKSKVKRNVMIGVGVVGAIITIYGIVIVMLVHEMATIPQHHLLHAVMTIGTGMLAMALAGLLPQKNGERAWWVILAVLAPAAGLFLMWPTMYAYLMMHPVMHALDHLGIALCALVAVFAAEAYVRGLGWPMVVLVVGMNAAAAGGFGTAPKTPASPEITAVIAKTKLAMVTRRPTWGSAGCVQ